MGGGNMAKQQRNGELVEINATSGSVPEFEYTSVAPSVAQFLRNQADRIRRSAAASIINVGKDLIAAKHYLSHGMFLIWVEKEVGIPPRTAQAYMQVAQWASHRNATVAHLPPSLLYLLSARSTPTTFIDEILARVEEGQPVELKRVRGELKAIRSKKHGGASPCRADRRDTSTEIMAPNESYDTPLMEAISIFIRGLSRHDFAKVRDLLTSKSVLEDPELPHSIEAAFWLVDAPPLCSDQPITRPHDDTNEDGPRVGVFGPCSDQ
jgi:Protein of unknown function (DUF3102)